MGNLVVAGPAAVLLLLDRHRLPHTSTAFGEANTSTHPATNSSSHTTTNATTDSTTIAKASPSKRSC